MAKKETPTTNDDTRVTLVISQTLQDKVKGLAYWERMKIKDVISTALQEYIDRYEKKNGNIKTAGK